MTVAMARNSRPVLAPDSDRRNDNRALGMARRLTFDSVNASCLFFGLALAVYLATSIVNMAMIQAFVSPLFFTAGRMGALALLFLSELLDAKRVGFAVWAAVIVLPLGVIVTCLSDLSGPLMILAFVWSSRRISFELSAKCAFWTIVLMCSVVWISWRAGVVPDYVWVQDGGLRTRRSLGFSYATYMSHFLLYATMLYAYIKKGRLKLAAYAVILLLNGYVFAMTDSRNAFYLTIAFLAATAVFRPMLAKSKPVGTNASVILALLFPVAASFWIVAMMGFDYSSDMLVDLNEFLGHRISISSTSYKIYGTTLFGQAVDFNGQGLNADWVNRPGQVTFVDNSFCNSWLKYGAVGTTLFLALYSAWLFRLGRKGDRLVILIFLIILVHVSIDSWWLVLAVNPFTLMCGALFGSEATVVGARCSPSFC